MKFNVNNTVGNILKGHSVKSSLISGLASSSLSGPLRSLATGLMGTKSTADVYITDLEKGDRMQLAYTPERISARESKRFQSYNIIERGEVKTPKGEDLTSVGWSAILPGESMLSYAFIKSSAWESPDTVLKRWNRWKEQGTKLNLMITQTSVNLHVYLEDFTNEPSGGMGNVEYRISFIAAKDLLIKTVQEVDAEKTAAAAEAANEQAQLRERAAGPLKTSHPFGMNDTLWSVAQGCLGDGAKWVELFDINRQGKINDPDGILPGTILHLR